MLVFAAPLTAALLAPGPKELEAARAEMDARMVRVEAIAHALGRVQGAWGEKAAAGGKPDPCEDPEVASLVARSRVFGDAYRDAVQSARAELDRLETLWASPTVVPLLDPDDRVAADALRDRVGVHSRAVLEASAWQAKVVDPTVRKCTVELKTTPGIGYAGPVAVGEEEQPVAVIAVGGGLVCPSQERAAGQVVVLVDGKACYGGTDCSCTPDTVLPGAVLGP